jgi:hypothetical protein
MDIGGDIYSPILATVNFICFGALLVCCLLVYFGVTVDQFKNQYKHVTPGALLTLIFLLVLHYILVDSLHIPLLVPPLNTPYFTAFLRVIQYLASIAFVLLLAVLFLLAVVGRFDKRYSEKFTSSFIYWVILVIIHAYLQSEFGILLIFPPTLW